MLRLQFNNGTIEIENPAFELQLLEKELTLRLRSEADAKAEQEALSVVYRIGGKPDPTRPYDGLLSKRLDIHETTAGDLIREGRIGYTCCGKKGYRVSERQVREFLGDLKQAC